MEEVLDAWAHVQKQQCEALEHCQQTLNPTGEMIACIGHPVTMWSALQHHTRKPLSVTRPICA